MRSFKIAVHAPLLIILFQLGCGHGGNSSEGGPSSAEAAGTCAVGPLALAKQGSFFVNATTRLTQFPTGNGTLNPAETISVRGMYVQYQIPQTVKPGVSPVILVHGANHSGKTFEETPDGRMGWAEYLVRCGVPVYVVDHSGRARSGFDPTPSNQAKVQGDSVLIPNFFKFTHEQAWKSFRFGPTLPTPHATTQFPVQAEDQYFAQLVPDTETSYTNPTNGQNTVAALAKLLEKIVNVDKFGPAVVLVHSQSGQYGIDVAIANPGLVKAVVSIEPASCTVPAADMPVIKQVPLLTIFGEFFNNVPATEWPLHMTECETTVAALNAAGGVAKNIHLLAPYNIPGNSHMLMMDKNNQEIADIILAWLAKPAP